MTGVIRYIRWLFLALVALGLVVLALANRGPVTLNLLPESMAAFAPFPTSLSLPLFLVILLALAAGLLLGFVWEWLREHRFRAEAARQRRAAEALEREVKTLKAPARRDKDDVLALLE